MSILEMANPDAVQGALPPTSGHRDVNGTRLYFDSRGSGPGVLLIGAADEDAEFFRPIAELLTGRTVVTYDRRGTFRSGREEWPGGGSTTHANDAAGLIRSLGLSKVAVFGSSAGGIVALELALRHPSLVTTALVFEPGLFCHVPDGERSVHQVYEQVSRYLEQYPSDWVGAVDTLGRAIAESMGGPSDNFFTPPPNREWYAQRAKLHAESLVRGDLPMTLRRVDESRLARCEVPIRFSHGANSLPVFGHITGRLASVQGEQPDEIAGAVHGVYYSPDVIAAYIMDHSG